MSACSHQGTDPTMSTRSPPRRPHLCLVTSQRSYLLSHQELSFQYIKFEEKKTYRPYEWSYEAKYSKAIALGAGKIKMMIMMVVSLKIFFKRFIHLCVCARAREHAFAEIRQQLPGVSSLFILLMCMSH